jgi:mRNA interferase MazF
VNLLRGDVWWVDLDPTRGSEINKKRPCVILSVDPLNKRRRTVVVIPLSTSPVSHPPLTVAVSVNGHAAVAVLDQVRGTKKERFSNRIGTLTLSELEAVEEALREILGLS